MIVFFGTSPYSAKFLELATKNGLKIEMIVSAGPKPIGRKQILTENPVITFAKANKIPFHTALAKISPKEDQIDRETIGLMFDFNRIIPKNIIDLFPKGIINIHFSKLPKYRGPAPVQATILNGDKEAWISYYLIDEKLDEGKIITQTSLPLKQTETTQSLYEILLQKVVSEIGKVVTDFAEGSNLLTQTGTATYTEKLTTEKAKINWEKSPEEIDRLIRAAFPEPGAWTTVRIKDQKSKIKDMRLKIIKAHLKNEKLILDEVQLEGKNKVTWPELQAGYPQVSFL